MWRGGGLGRGSHSTLVAKLRKRRNLRPARQVLVEPLERIRRERLGMADHDEILEAAPPVIARRVGEEARLVPVDRDDARRGLEELVQNLAAVERERAAVAEGLVARAAGFLREREAPVEIRRHAPAGDRHLEERAVVVLDQR